MAAFIRTGDPIHSMGPVLLATAMGTIWFMKSRDRVNAMTSISAEIASTFGASWPFAMAEVEQASVAHARNVKDGFEKYLNVHTR